MTFFNLFGPKKTAYPCCLEVRFPKNFYEKKDHFKKVILTIMENKEEFHVKFDIEFFFPVFSGMVNGDYVYSTILGTINITEHKLLSDVRAVEHVKAFINNGFYERQVAGDFYGSFAIGYGSILKD